MSETISKLWDAAPEAFRAAIVGMHYLQAVGLRVRPNFSLVKVDACGAPAARLLRFDAADPDATVTFFMTRDGAALVERVSGDNVDIAIIPNARERFAEALECVP